MNEEMKACSCQFAIKSGKRIVQSLRSNAYFTTAWEKVDSECGKEFFESLFAKIIDDESRRTQPDNAPLTLDELMGSHGEPLYFRMIEEQETPFDLGPHWFICDLNKLPASWYDYGKTWLAYRRKPEPPQKGEKG